MENDDYYSDDETDLYSHMSSEQKEAGLRLVKAVKENDLIEIENNIAGPFIPDRIGQTPLHYAALNGNLSVVQYLLKQFSDLDIDHKSAAERTSLQIACCNGHLDVVKFFVENGADVNMCDMMGYHSLLWAVENGHLPVIIYLLNETDVNISIQNNWEEDVFLLASESENREVVDLFERLADNY